MKLRGFFIKFLIIIPLGLIYSSSFAQYSIQWDTLQYLTEIYPGVVIKDTSVAGSCSRGISKNFIPSGQDGWVEVRAGQDDKKRIFGFAPKMVACSSNVTYGIRIDTNSHFYKIGGALDVDLGTYDTNDVFRVSIEGDSVYFLKNDVKLSVLSYTSNNYKIAIRIDQEDGVFEYPVCSENEPYIDTITDFSDANIKSNAPTKTYYFETIIQDYAATRSSPAIYYRGLLKFDIDSLKPTYKIYDAKLYLYGNSASGSYSSFLNVITSSWVDTTVCWYNQPSTTTTYQISITSFTAAVYNSFNITDIVKAWASGEYSNNGLMLLLQSTSRDASLKYNSSNAVSYRPYTIIVYSSSPPFSKLQKIPDGGYYSCDHGHLYFEYLEEYYRAPGAKLCYSIYDDKRNLLTGVGLNNDPMGNGALQHFVKKGYNKYDFDLTGLGLTDGKFYMLEVQNPKQEKWYLRFKY